MLAASSVSWLAAPAFSRGQYMRVGLTCVGIRLTDITALMTWSSRRQYGGLGPDARCRRVIEVHTNLAMFFTHDAASVN